MVSCGASLVEQPELLMPSSQAASEHSVNTSCLRTVKQPQRENYVCCSLKEKVEVLSQIFGNWNVEICVPLFDESEKD